MKRVRVRNLLARGNTRKSCPRDHRIAIKRLKRPESETERLEIRCVARLVPGFLGSSYCHVRRTKIIKRIAIMVYNKVIPYVSTLVRETVETVQPASNLKETKQAEEEWIRTG